MRQHFIALSSLVFLLVLALSEGSAVAQLFPKTVPLPMASNPKGLRSVTVSTSIRVH